MPIDANHYGTVHGASIFRMVDEAALVTATKHARRNAVLASMDHIVFKHPVRIGDLLSVEARLSYVGKSSMEILVNITTERLKEGKVLNVGSAHLTMVALDEEGKPAIVPGLRLKTKTDKTQSKLAISQRKKRLST